MVRLIDPGTYLGEVFTDEEWQTVERRLLALGSIPSCDALTRSLLGDAVQMQSLHTLVRTHVRIACNEDQAGVWRRRGAGAWRHVEHVCKALGMAWPKIVAHYGACENQVRFVIADALCDVEIAEQAGSRGAIEPAGCRPPPFVDELDQIA